MALSGRRLPCQRLPLARASLHSAKFKPGGLQARMVSVSSLRLRSTEHRTPVPAQDSGSSTGLRFQHRDSVSGTGLRFQHRTPVQRQKGRPQIQAADRGKIAIITVGSLGKLRLPTVKTTGPRVIMAESLESTARRVINGRKRRETDRAAGS